MKLAKNGILNCSMFAATVSVGAANGQALIVQSFSERYGGETVFSLDGRASGDLQAPVQPPSRDATHAGTTPRPSGGPPGRAIICKTKTEKGNYPIHKKPS
jgi:hypothetical protein